MPGYDRTRFVDLQAQDEDEFMCGICHDIYNKPVVVSCCQQTYCEDCINQWLNTNQSCPNDRSALNKNNISPAPRLVLNLLNRLKITCDYKNQGCQHVCTLENLQAHLKNQCEYNPLRKCLDCGGIKEESGDHNCVRTLCRIVRALANNLDELQLQVNSISEVLANNQQEQRINLGDSSLFVDEIHAIRRDLENNDVMNRTTIESLSESLSKLMLDTELLKGERLVNPPNPNI